MAKESKPTRSWRHLRTILNKADRKDLLNLVGDLYALRKENQNFLHARVLKNPSSLDPYKKIIERNVSPADLLKHPIRLSSARKAISDYRKAVGDPAGLAELMLFYVEFGINFTLELGEIDEAFYSSMDSVYYDGMQMLNRCDKDVTCRLLPRFEALLHSTVDMGWGVYGGFRDTFEAYCPEV